MKPIAVYDLQAEAVARRDALRADGIPAEVSAETVGPSAPGETQHVAYVPKEDAVRLFPDQTDEAYDYSAGQKCPHCGSGKVEPKRGGCGSLLMTMLVIPALVHMVKQRRYGYLYECRECHRDFRVTLSSS